MGQKQQTIVKKKNKTKNNANVSSKFFGEGGKIRQVSNISHSKLKELTGISHRSLGNVVLYDSVKSRNIFAWLSRHKTPKCFDGLTGITKESSLYVFNH